MFLTKLKTVTAVLVVALGTAVEGAALFHHETASAQQTKPSPDPSADANAKNGQPAPEPAKQPAWKELFTVKHEAAVTAVGASDEIVAVTDARCRLRLWGAVDGKELTLPMRGRGYSFPPTH